MPALGFAASGLGVALNAAQPWRSSRSRRVRVGLFRKPRNKLTRLGAFVFHNSVHLHTGDREIRRCLRNLLFRHHTAQHARHLAEIAAQRHQDHPRLGLLPILSPAQKLQLHHSGGGENSIDMRCEGRAVGRIHERLGRHAAHFHAHHLAERHARQPHPQLARVQLLKDEHMLQRILKLARVKLRTIRRQPPLAQAFPVGSQIGYHIRFHILMSQHPVSPLTAQEHQNMCSPKR